MKILSFLLVLFSSLILFGLNFGSDYDQDLQLAIQATKESKTLQELKVNPNSPQNTFQSIARRPLNTSKLCEALLGLEAESLALFEETLTSQQTSLDLPCYNEAINKITSFYHLQSSVFYMSAEKDKQYKAEAGLQADMSWSTLRQIQAVGPKQTVLFAGTVGVDTRGGAVIYQRDPFTGHNERLDLKRGEIILTFDDGPHETRTRSISHILDRHHVKAVFFALGSRAQQRPQIVRDVIMQGNVYGSHSQTHPQLPKIPFDRAKSEIKTGHLHVVNAANGEDSGFFRFPYGARNNQLVGYLKENALASFFWNMDSLDWKLTNATTLYNHTVDEINREQKGVLLFHDIHLQTVSILNALLENLHEAGYTIKVAVPNEWLEAK